MKKALLVASMLAIATPASFAQDASGTSAFLREEAPVQYLAKDRLIGTKVKGPDGKIIGDIEDIILSGNHEVSGVVMGTGGFLGLFEKKVGVDIKALQFDVVDGRIETSLPSYTKESLDAAPAFVRNHPKKSLFARAVEKGQEIRDKTGASVKETYEQAKEKAGPAIEKAKEAAKEGYEKAKETAKEAIDNAGPAVQDAKERVKEAIETAKEKAKEVVDKAKEAAKPADETAPAPAPEAAPSTPAPEAAPATPAPEATPAAPAPEAAPTDAAPAEKPSP